MGEPTRCANPCAAGSCLGAPSYVTLRERQGVSSRSAPGRRYGSSARAVPRARRSDGRGASRTGGRFLLRQSVGILRDPAECEPQTVSPVGQRGQAALPASDDAASGRSKRRRQFRPPRPRRRPAGPTRGHGRRTCSRQSKAWCRRRSSSITSSSSSCRVASVSWPSSRTAHRGAIRVRYASRSFTHCISSVRVLRVTARGLCHAALPSDVRNDGADHEDHAADEDGREPGCDDMGQGEHGGDQQEIHARQSDHPGDNEPLDRGERGFQIGLALLASKSHLRRDELRGRVQDAAEELPGRQGRPSSRHRRGASRCCPGSARVPRSRFVSARAGDP
jgi:hypothetical protein